MNESDTEYTHQVKCATPKCDAMAVRFYHGRYLCETHATQVSFEELQEVRDFYSQQVKQNLSQEKR